MKHAAHAAIDEDRQFLAAGGNEPTPGNTSIGAPYTGGHSEMSVILIPAFYHSSPCRIILMTARSYYSYTNE
ncbi:hypothetical protein [Acidocella sp.]|uniref:hypothetical protein n=1 Tax=Acidocella sp. TaxID=50710 RepID=UPI003D070F48